LLARGDHVGWELSIRRPEAEAERRRSGLGKLEDPRVCRHIPAPESVGKYQLTWEHVPTRLLKVGRVDAPDLATLLAFASDESEPELPLSNEITKLHRQVRSFGAYPRRDDRR
jgi:hypothetical protein